MGASLSLAFFQFKVEAVAMLKSR